MKHERIGFAICGSFCTHDKALEQLRQLTEEYETVIPILSEISAVADTRFGTAEALLEQAESLCGQKAIQSIPAAEPIGPKKLLDALVVAPCTGNTLAKLAAGITDSTVTMACKAHLRNGKPLLLALSTNDGLSTAARNIGDLLCRRGIYFVPFGQDDPAGKPRSLVAKMELLPQALEAALEGRQLQPILR